MAVVEGEILGEMIGPCMHHIYSVSFATVSLMFFLKEFMGERQISLFIVSATIRVIITCSFIEAYAICFVARVALE